MRGTGTATAAAWAMRLAAVTAAAFAAAGAASDQARGEIIVRDARDAAGPLDILGVGARQSGPRLRVLIRTEERVRLAALARKPELDAPGRTRYLCLRLQQSATRVLCLAKTEAHGQAVYVSRIGAGNEVEGTRRATGLRLGRPARTRLEIRGSLRAFGLRPGKARVRGLSDWAGPACSPAPADETATTSTLCRDRAPDGGVGRLRVIRPALIGCTRDENRVVYSGPRTRPRVALTFDDGPGPYTDDVLRILRDHRAKATFFVIGREVSRYPGLVRREVRRGHEVGNQSYSHTANPSYGDIAEASRRIRAASGFTPCTFRPPYGALAGSTINSAWSLGMSTIMWDVDPQDWSQPGAATIQQRVVGGARAGSIVVLHDGGGYRGQTVAALPGIIHGLRDRGFRLVTVTKLLRERWRWRP